MRRTIEITGWDLNTESILQWGRRFDPFVFLNSNTEKQLQQDTYGKYDFVLAADSIGAMQEDDAIASLRTMHEETGDWVFGYFSYDVKNQLEKLKSGNPDGVKAPLFYFFVPRFVITGVNNKIVLHYDDKFDDRHSAEKIFRQLHELKTEFTSQVSLEMKPRVPKEEYISNFNKIKNHIQSGDIYELNYCIEFYHAGSEIEPEQVYMNLNELSPMPMSAFVHINDVYTLCASPERYLAKRKNKIISQPIKGTIRRDIDKNKDEQLKKQLRDNAKEQAENVMIVDMVRNDLSRTAKRESVKVEELFGIKSFHSLHQMVSTVVSEIKDGIHFTEAIAKSFPMGSMTGAPKVSAMKLIEQYESTRRGIYSGSIGYVEPHGDFDFNVVIRSIVFNRANKYLSYMAGSAITIGSDGEQEYEECMLKASTMKQVLTKQNEHAR